MAIDLKNRELPQSYAFYKANQAGEYLHENVRVDEQNLVLCSTGQDHYTETPCMKRAINYSSKCLDHGGIYGPDAMSRLEKFRNGYIGVKDLDYEELRSGVTRGNSGTVVARSGPTQVKMTEQQYREMVQELYVRHDGQMRGLLDKALVNVEKILDAEFQTTITEGKTTVVSGVAAGDKLRAAQFVWQTVRGKMPENVNLTIDSKPFERVFEGMARGLTREQSQAMRKGIEIPTQAPLEAEVIEEPEEEKPKRERTCPDSPEVPEDPASDSVRRSERVRAAREREAGIEQRVADSAAPNSGPPKKSWEDYVRDQDGD